MLRMQKKGQITLEYIIIIIIVMGALLAISNYFKRGLQGRWKAALDDLGDQYDPRAANSSLRHTLVSSTNTSIFVINRDGGYWTMRTDESLSTERKQGTVSVGSY